MTLFICAFFGNFFYVASVVSSPGFNLPPPLSTKYIQDSIPYVFILISLRQLNLSHQISLGQWWYVDVRCQNTLQIGLGDTDVHTLTSMERPVVVLSRGIDISHWRHWIAMVRYYNVISTVWTLDRPCTICNQLDDKVHVGIVRICEGVQVTIFF